MNQAVEKTLGFELKHLKKKTKKQRKTPFNFSFCLLIVVGTSEIGLLSLLM